MNLEISEILAAERPFIAPVERTTAANISRDIQRLLSVAWVAVGDDPAARHAAFNVAVYHPGGMVEVGVITDAPAAMSDAVVWSVTPSGPAATATHWGEYSTLGNTHNAIRNWIVANDRIPHGTVWEIYGHWDADPSKCRTDLFHLLR